MYLKRFLLLSGLQLLAVEACSSSQSTLSNSGRNPSRAGAPNLGHNTGPEASVGGQRNSTGGGTSRIAGAGSHASPVAVAGVAQPATIPPSRPTVAAPVVRGPSEVLCKDGVDNDHDGKTDCNDWDCQSPGGDCVPAPPLDRTVASTVVECSRYLRIGDNTLQKDFQPSAVIGDSIVVGKVVDTAGSPIAGVRVSAKNRPDFGYTHTLSTGSFHMAVNSGQELSFVFALDGYIEVTRTVHTEFNWWTVIPDIGLTERKVGRKTPLVMPSPNCQAARSNQVTDNLGTREVLVVFPPETNATIQPPGAAPMALTHLTSTITLFPSRKDDRYVSASTEVNSGAALVGNGAIGFDMDVAEARERSADRVELSQPISIYVPDPFERKASVTGRLDEPPPVRPRRKKRRDSETNPRPLASGIIRIVAISGGLAQVDTSGDEKPESEETLAGFGITVCDREQLAHTFKRGARLNFVKQSYF